MRSIQSGLKLSHAASRWLLAVALIAAVSWALPPAADAVGFDFDPASGMPSNPRTFARWERETDRPDGAAVDSAGHYWIAHFRGGKVVEIDPSGRTVREIPFPAMCPTMCAFGGPDLRTLYATSARQDRPADELERFPQSGGVFAMRVDVPGLPEPRYAG